MVAWRLLGLVGSYMCFIGFLYTYQAGVRGCIRGDRVALVYIPSKHMNYIEMLSIPASTHSVPK